MLRSAFRGKVRSSIVTIVRSALGAYLHWGLRCFLSVDYIVILGVFFSVVIVENEVIFRKPIIVALCLAFLVPIPIVYRRTSVEKGTEGEK